MLMCGFWRFFCLRAVRFLLLCITSCSCSDFGQKTDIYCQILPYCASRAILERFFRKIHNFGSIFE